eukprot:4288472-Heterocapsa_arctica.AAC.1
MPSGDAKKPESAAARLMREAGDERRRHAIATAATNTRTSFAEGSTPSGKRRDAEEEISPMTVQPAR